MVGVMNLINPIDEGNHMNKIKYPEEVDFSDINSINKFIDDIIADDRFRDVRHKMTILSYIFLTILYKKTQTTKGYSFIIYILGIFTGGFISAFLTTYQPIYIILGIILLLVAFVVMIIPPRGGTL